MRSRGRAPGEPAIAHGRSGATRRALRCVPVALGLMIVLLSTAPETRALQEPSASSASALGPEHGQMAAYVGTWEVYMSSPSGTEPGAEPIGTAAARLRLDGAFLEVEVHAESGPVSHAIYTLSFDTRHGDYAVVLMDSAGTYFVTARGKPDPDSTRIAMYGKDDDPMMTSMGLDKEFVIAFDFQAADRLVLETLFIDTRTPERKELPFLTFELRR